MQQWSLQLRYLHKYIDNDHEYLRIKNWYIKRSNAGFEFLFAHEYEKLPRYIRTQIPKDILGEVVAFDKKLKARHHPHYYDFLKV
jgi:hypothetical protein